ncbi:hypothetical protein DYB32_008280 [Aphanomyces invadans]|uniref:Uncharacterized protein n=1 Tax=Aphanomyces invadans TaxID=157072 RepID=A0A3R6Y3H2_9STRA|nr:hypothetical protein DYB32_008280 [Aphanomyces invadans]
MAHSALPMPRHPVGEDAASQGEKRKKNVDHSHVDLTSTAKRVKVDDVAPETPPSKASALWVQQSHVVVGKPKPAMMRKSASVNDLWVKQSIAFVTRDA